MGPEHWNDQVRVRPDQWNEQARVGLAQWYRKCKGCDRLEPEQWNSCWSSNQSGSVGPVQQDGGLGMGPIVATGGRPWTANADLWSQFTGNQQQIDDNTADRKRSRVRVGQVLDDDQLPPPGLVSSDIDTAQSSAPAQT